MSELRHPSWLLNGYPCLEFDVLQNSLASSDTGHGRIPMTLAHPDEFLKGGAFSIVVNGASLIEGTITQVECDFVARTINVQGKDKTAGLLKKLSIEKFQNQKGAEVAKEIAGRHGLSLTGGGGSLNAGKLFQTDWTALFDHVSEWAAINHIADREGMSVTLDGKAGQIILSPEGETFGEEIAVRYVPPTPQSYAQGNFMHLRVVKNIEISGKTKVKVSSWNTKKKEAVTAEKEETGDAGGDPTVYEYRIPGLNQEQADRIAEKRLGENTRHAMTIDLDMPGDETASPRAKLNLSGTGTSCDQGYVIDRIEHRGNADEGGYRMTITGKNKVESGGGGAGLGGDAGSSTKGVTSEALPGDDRFKPVQ